MSLYLSQASYEWNRDLSNLIWEVEEAEDFLFFDAIWKYKIEQQD